MALGSGFFVATNVFLTCCHVVNGDNGPHQAGDLYHLVTSLVNGKSGKLHSFEGKIGENLFLDPDHDAAIFLTDRNHDQAFLSISYEELSEGAEIGVAGYPLPTITLLNGQLSYGTLLFRVGRGVITALYEAAFDHCAVAPIIEVNFLFVPGNSGGPIFDVATGRVLGFVRGYTPEIINESVQTCRLPDPNVKGKYYISALTAIYSHGLRFGSIRQLLESHGVTLG